MFMVVIFLMVAGAVVAKGTSGHRLVAALFTEDAVQQKELWENFKTKFTKKYVTVDEEVHRFQVFLENLRMADRRNEMETRLGGSAVHGVTMFSDLSQAEFESWFLSSAFSPANTSHSVDATKRVAEETKGLVEWSKYLSPDKSQGKCGAGWAFSVAEQIESDATRILGVSYRLSPEQIVQCSPKAHGCDGGSTPVAYDYLINGNGIVTESNYPYTSYGGATGTCHVDTAKAVLQVKGYYTLSSESAMAGYVQSTGPLSACVDASSWLSYQSGVMSSCGTTVNHCIQVVGVDVSNGYWKLRNSWSSGWGENGWIRLKFGQNTCAVADIPTYTTVSKASV
eukprot:gene19012-13718_t